MAVIEPAIHICVPARKSCYAVFWSYGQICVGCGCCGKPSRQRSAARLRYWRKLLKHSEEFDIWSDDLNTCALQEQNVKADIRYFQRRMRYYERALAERGKQNGADKNRH